MACNRNGYCGENNVLVVGFSAVVAVYTYVVSCILVIEMEGGRKIT